MKNKFGELTEDPDSSNGRTRSIFRILWRLFAFGVSGYVLLIAVIVANESQLVYPGSKYPRGNWQPDFEFEDVKFNSVDDMEIHGWFLPQPGATETVLLCHGNAENVAQSAASSGIKFRDTLNANVFVFDYRGFGKSEGSPFEEVILKDTELAMKWLNQRTGTRPDEIIVAGHSIGGGPAVHVAAKLGAKALFLQRTFASLVAPAQKKYWFVPVNWLMRNRYPSAEKISACGVPLHQSHPEADELVPLSTGKELFDACPATVKQFYLFQDAGHWDQLPNEYWDSCRVFLKRVNSIEAADRARQAETQ